MRRGGVLIAAFAIIVNLPGAGRATEEDPAKADAFASPAIRRLTRWLDRPCRNNRKISTSIQRSRSPWRR